MPTTAANISPAIEPVPFAGLSVAIDHMIRAVLRAGRAGMIWQNTHQASDRKSLRDIPVGRSVAAANDAMLLVGGGDRVAFDQIALQVANRAVAVVASLLRGTAVAADRHPSGIDDRPALLGLMADDGGEN